MESGSVAILWDIVNDSFCMKTIKKRGHIHKFKEETNAHYNADRGNK